MARSSPASMGRLAIFHLILLQALAAADGGSIGWAWRHGMLDCRGGEHSLACGKDPERVLARGAARPSGSRDLESPSPQACFLFPAGALSGESRAVCRPRNGEKGRRETGLWRCSSSNDGKNGREIDQGETPLIDALEAASAAVKAPFFFPGHRMGTGMGFAMRERIMPGSTLALDLPEDVEGIDCLISSSSKDGPISRAQAAAADLFGASRTWFLCNGSSCGIIASVIAAVQLHSRTRPASPPGTVIIPRNCHKSAVHALVLSGATPAYIDAAYDEEMGVHHGIVMADLAEALERNGQDVAAVLIVSPTYFGAISDVRTVADMCHSFGVPLIVDEAHGSHLSFVGYSNAIECGADVAVQSTHKTLTALTQASMLHMGHRRGSRGMDDDDDDDDDDAEGGLQKSCAGQEGDREGRKRKKCCWPPEGYMDDLGDALDQALELMQSSSPSSLLLASLDAARWQFGCELGGGRKAMEESVDSAMRVRAKLASVPGLSILTEPCPRDQDKGYIGVDPLRISVNTAKICTGFEAADAMENGYGVYCEVATHSCVTIAMGVGCTREQEEMLIASLSNLEPGTKNAEKLSAAQRSDQATSTGDSDSIEASKSPRRVFMSSAEQVPLDRAVGRVSSEMVVTYPPGIPILFPGEVISIGKVRELKGLVDGKAYITGARDTSLATIRVAKQ